jgi:hypothetical protein
MTEQQRQHPAAPSVRNSHAVAATAIRGPGLLTLAAVMTLERSGW